MSGQLLRTAAALRDLNEQAKFIQQDSPEAAIRFLAAAQASFERLAAMPGLGQRQDFGQEKLAGLRVWQVRDFPNYVIFYRPIDGGVEIVRVLHSARDVDAALAEKS